MQKYVIGNWKLHPRSIRDALRIVQKVAGGTLPTRVNVWLAPPAPFLESAIRAAKKSAVGRRFRFGGQYAFQEHEGAFTGAVSGSMLKSLGATFVIVGHSERRAYFGETDAIVNTQLRAAIKSGLTAVLCVGERTRDHDGTYVRMVKEQIHAALKGVSAAATAKLMIAYEPIWAIGTGHPATAADVSEMALFIERVLTDLYNRTVSARIPILYGGSVDADVARKVIHLEHVNGFLVGGASKNPKAFREIITVTGGR
ncbi:MAG: triose-phosphate isomerase [Patescibacteria group bacterium]